jgi:sterol desaturase/sphingolipid hydroxylase (fatty acid hydroxylase superfamily)
MTSIHNRHGRSEGIVDRGLHCRPMSWLPRPFDPAGYFFWLVLVSVACLALERVRPWRRQRVLRKGIGQDLFWLVFNGHFAGLMLALVVDAMLGWAAPAAAWLERARLLAGMPPIAQGLLAFVIKDLLEWSVHNMLHRVPWLWAIHRVHHSIEELDWIGNFRFHWGEIVVYRAITWLPLALLGVDLGVLLVLAVVSTALGHLNHSNLDVTWGRLRWLLNSPRMHVWHHDRAWPAGRSHGVNFGIALSVWDWCFGTAYWPSREEAPAQQPVRLGFPGLERFPSRTIDRLLYPLSRFWLRDGRRECAPARADTRSAAQGAGRSSPAPPGGRSRVRE